MKELFKYNPKTGEVTRLSSNKIITLLDGRGYLKTTVNYKQIIVHRLAWYLHYGSWPSKHIDHINGIKTDNRIENLREVTIRENSMNRLKHRNGKLVGCSYRLGGSSWQAQIKKNGKSIHLGNFKTELEAHKAYISALEV